MGSKRSFETPVFPLVDIAKAHRCWRLRDDQTDRKIGVVQLAVLIEVPTAGWFAHYNASLDEAAIQVFNRGSVSPLAPSVGFVP
jgi:hypothetical protein